jgi:hypothetical protein
MLISLKVVGKLIIQRKVASTKDALGRLSYARGWALLLSDKIVCVQGSMALDGIIAFKITVVCTISEVPGPYHSVFL